MSARLDVWDRSVEKANVWVNDVAAELGSDDRHHAYRVLRAFLHALRDRLTVAEAAQLAAQLPLLIRGVFYEGWTPGGARAGRRDAARFLDDIAAEALLHGETEASYAVAAVMRVVRRHVSAGELEDVDRLLPQELRPLLSG